MSKRPIAFAAVAAVTLMLLAASAQAQTVITPSGAADNGGNMGQGRDPEKAIDRSGLYDVETIGTELDDTHDGTRANHWGATWASNRTYTLTLPEPSTIDRVYLWTAAGTFTTLEGDVIAEYLFDGDAPSSSDLHYNADAGDIDLGEGIPTSLRDDRIACAAAEVAGLDLGGSDYFGFTITIPARATLTLSRLTYTYEEANSYQPQHVLWSDLTGEVMSPVTRYAPPSQRNSALYSTRTLVHNLTETGATFAGLSGTNVEFRVYVGDGAKSTGEQRFDDIRLYAIDSTRSSTVLIVR